MDSARDDMESLNYIKGELSVWERLKSLAATILSRDDLSICNDKVEWKHLNWGKRSDICEGKVGNQMNDEGAGKIRISDSLGSDWVIGVKIELVTR